MHGRWKTWTVGLLVGIAAMVPSSVEACLWGPQWTPDPATQDVKKAERLLAKGRSVRAVNIAKGRYERFTAATGTPDRGKALFHRAQRLIALATVRSGGRMNLGPGMRGRTEDQQRSNLAWATSMLEIHAATEPDNLLFRVFYAEALLEYPEGAAQVVAMLEPLQRDDIMPSARGFAVLARAHHQLGDASSGELSQRRCLDLGASEALCAVS